MGTIAEEWTASRERMESLQEGASPLLAGPEQVPLQRLADPQDLLAQLEALTHLLETASCLLLVPEEGPAALECRTTLVCSDYFRILADGREDPAKPAPLIEAFLEAGQRAIAEGKATAASSFLGPGSLWACPVHLHFGNRSYAKAVLVVFAFPPAELLPAPMLAEKFPAWLGPRAEDLERAARRLEATALPPRRLSLVRRLLEHLAAAFSEELSTRYQTLLAFQGLETKGEQLRRQRLELDERNRLLNCLGTQYAAELASTRDDRDEQDQRRREAEAARGNLERSVESLQAELRWREELFREVSHDLKAPLTTIRAFAEILGTLDESERDQARDFQRIIKEESERLAVLVDQVLDLARLETGHGNLAPEPAHPAELIEQVGRLFQARMRESAFTLTVETSPELPEVLWDRDGILRVLINLVDNALRFIPPAGQVAIRAYPAGDPGARAVFLEVEDNGPGIPEEKRDKVFQRFYTAPPEHGKHRGTGLGLAISKGIAEAHGGTICVERGKMGGALFRVCLPLGSE